MNDKRVHGIAHGLTCGLCVLRQWFNILVYSCSIMENMFVKVKTKIVSYIVDVMFSKVSEYEDHLWHHIVYV